MVVTHNRRVIDAYDIFVEGQVVRLLTGSQPLTIIDVCEDCGDVTVAYTTSDGDIDVLDLPAATVRIDEAWVLA